MILHAKHAARANRGVILQSLDTDVLVLSVSLFRSLDYPELWFRTGLKDRHRLTLPMLWMKRCIVRSLDSMQSQAVIRLALWLVSRLGRIWHRSQVHQNVSSNRLFTSAFSLLHIPRIRNTFWLKTVRFKISHDQPISSTNTLARTTSPTSFPGSSRSRERTLETRLQNPLNGMTSVCMYVTLSGLARPGRWAFVSKWRLPMPNFGLLWRLISWDIINNY